MAVAPTMLWFSVATEAGTTEYELPDDESWLTIAQWTQYAELNRLASENGTTVQCSDRQRPPLTTS
jgi:hypothetical protein